MIKIFKSVVISICLITLLVGCGSSKVIEKVKYNTYGLFNQDDHKNPNIQYEVIWGNVLWAAILCETIIAPIYFIGFSMFEPVGQKTDSNGQVIK